MKGLHRDKISTGRQRRSSTTDFSYGTCLHVQDRQPGGSAGSNLPIRCDPGEHHTHLLSRMPSCQRLMQTGQSVRNCMVGNESAEQEV